MLVAVPRMLHSLKDKIELDLESTDQMQKFRMQYQAAEGSSFLRRWWKFRDLHRRFGWKFWAFLSGGAALDGETEEFWSRLGFAVIQGYGLTETTSLVSVNHPFRVGRGSIGKILPGREVMLADDGEILVRGGAVASGYWQANQMRAKSPRAVRTRCRRRAESAWRPLRIVSVRAPATASPAGLRLVMRPGLSFRR